MSATILDNHSFCETLGIDESKACFIRAESPFDPDKSPIYTVCNCKTSYSDLQDVKNLSTICSTVESILKIYPDSKGIIHTGNMRISRYLKEHINSNRLLVRLDDWSNRVIYEKHINSTEPTVLVSSSMAEGVDLKDDLSRFQIIVKMPFESLADTRIKKLVEISPSWYQVEMFRKLIQECGRSTRNENDYCDTYILDSSFIKFLGTAKSKDWLPSQFIKRIRKIN
jgi:ATP-dependent DNA helicase DinG